MRTLFESGPSEDLLRQYLVPGKSVLIKNQWWTISKRDLDAGTITLKQSEWAIKDGAKPQGDKAMKWAALTAAIRNGTYGVKLGDTQVGPTQDKEKRAALRSKSGKSKAPGTPKAESLDVPPLGEDEYDEEHTCGWCTYGAALQALPESVSMGSVVRKSKKAQVVQVTPKVGRFTAFSALPMPSDSKGVKPGWVYPRTDYDQGKLHKDAVIDDFDLKHFLTLIDKAMNKLKLPKTLDMALVIAKPPGSSASASGWMWPGTRVTYLNRKPSATATSKFAKWRCPRSPHTMVHEYGHTIWFSVLTAAQRAAVGEFFAKNVKVNPAAAKASKTSPTTYASTKVEEWWAECIGYAMYGPGERISKPVFKFLQDVLSNKLDSIPSVLPKQKGQKPIKATIDLGALTGQKGGEKVTVSTPAPPETDVKSKAVKRIQAFDAEIKKAVGNYGVEMRKDGSARVIPDKNPTDKEVQQQIMVVLGLTYKKPDKEGLMGRYSTGKSGGLVIHESLDVPPLPLEEAQRVAFKDLAIGTRFARSGMSMVYEKTSQNAAKLIKATTGEPGGKPSRQKPFEEVVVMGPKAKHYDPYGPHPHPDNVIPEAAGSGFAQSAPQIPATADASGFVSQRDPIPTSGHVVTPLGVEPARLSGGKDQVSTSSTLALKDDLVFTVADWMAKNRGQSVTASAVRRGVNSRSGAGVTAALARLASAGKLRYDQGSRTYMMESGLDLGEVAAEVATWGESELWGDAGKPGVKESAEYGLRWTEGKVSGRPRTKEKFFATSRDREAFANKVEKKDTFIEFVAWSGPHESLDESAVAVLATLGSVALGGLLGHLTVKLKRAVQAMVKMYKADGKASASEKGWLKLTLKERAQINALLKGQGVTVREDAQHRTQDGESHVAAMFGVKLPQDLNEWDIPPLSEEALDEYGQLSDRDLKVGLFYVTGDGRHILFVTGKQKNGSAKGVHYDVERNKSSKASFKGYNLKGASALAPRDIDGGTKASIARKLDTGKSFEDFTESEETDTVSVSEEGLDEAQKGRGFGKKEGLYLFRPAPGEDVAYYLKRKGDVVVSLPNPEKGAFHYYPGSGMAAGVLSQWKKEMVYGAKTTDVPADIKKKLTAALKAEVKRLDARMSGPSLMVDGERVTVGDWVGFKYDYERSGRIVRISGGFATVEYEADGEADEYNGGSNDTVTIHLQPRDMWVESEETDTVSVLDEAASLQLQVWPKGEASTGSLTVRTSMPLKKAMGDIEFWVQKQRPSWVGKDLHAIQYGNTPLRFELSNGKLRKLKESLDEGGFTGLGPPRDWSPAAVRTVVAELARWPLKKLRKHQALNQKQAQVAHSKGDTIALENLDMMANVLAAAVSKRALGESLDEGYQHVEWKGSKSLRFKVSMPGGKKTVQGRTFGKYIGLHMNNKTRKWTATHIPTGLAFAYTEFGEKTLIARVKSLESKFGDELDFTDTGDVSPELQAAFGAVRKGLRESLDEAVLKTGNPGVPQIGYEQGRYWYSTGGVKNGPAIPPGKRKDRSFAREKFRQMLSNEADGGMGQAAASKLIDKLDAMVGEDVEGPPPGFEVDPAEFSAAQALTEAQATKVKQDLRKHALIPTMWQLDDRMKADGLLPDGMALAFFCPVYFAGQKIVEALLGKNDEHGELLLFPLPSITDPDRIREGLHQMHRLGISNPKQHLAKIKKGPHKGEMALRTFSSLPGIEGVGSGRLYGYIAAEAVQLGAFMIVPKEWLNEGDPYNQSYRFPGERGFSPFWRVPPWTEFQKMRPDLAKNFVETASGVVSKDSKRTYESLDEGMFQGRSSSDLWLSRLFFALREKYLPHGSMEMRDAPAKIAVRIKEALAQLGKESSPIYREMLAPLTVVAKAHGTWKEAQKAMMVAFVGESSESVVDEDEGFDLYDGLDEAGGNISAGGVLFNSSGKVLLRKPTGNFGGYAWTYPKGQVDEGETKQEAAIREVREETGYEAKILKKIGQFRGTTGTTLFYLMSPVRKVGGMDNETEAMRWVSPEKAVDMIAESTSIRGRERDLLVLAAAVKVHAKYPTMIDMLKFKIKALLGKVTGGSTAVTEALLQQLDETGNPAVLARAARKAGDMFVVILPGNVPAFVPTRRDAQEMLKAIKNGTIMSIRDYEEMVGETLDDDDVLEFTHSSTVGGFRGDPDPNGFSKGGPGGGPPLDSKMKLKGSKYMPHPPAAAGDARHGGGDVAETLIVPKDDLQRFLSVANALQLPDDTNLTSVEGGYSVTLPEELARAAQEALDAAPAS